MNDESRSISWTEDQIRTLVREVVRETRAHPQRPDGTYNWSTEAICQHVLDEYYEPKRGWLSRLFDGAANACYSSDYENRD